MNRKEFIGSTAGSAAFVMAGTSLGKEAAMKEPVFTSEDVISKSVAAARPLSGGAIPADLAARLGATHYGGKYHLTDEPYLIEGCRALQKLGMGVAKFWFGPKLDGYGYNSNWDLKRDATLTEIACHPYFAQAFGFPFKAFALEISVRLGRPDYKRDEEQFYDLTRHLMSTYKDRDVTFLLQHWEGDWMFRGKAGAKWEPGGPPDVDQRADDFVRWMSARQRGVTRARADAPPSKCRVYHAIEVNRVFDTLKGIPTICSHVLPRVALDYVSWSSYDGMKNAANTWKGLEIIRHYARPAPGHDKPRVFIGEVGFPERNKTRAQIMEWWDRAMAVFFAQDIPYIIHWELYCNEPVDGDKKNRRVRTADEMRGFWLLRPDGSLSHGGEYLTALLKHAGGTLPDDVIRVLKS